MLKTELFRVQTNYGPLLVIEWPRTNQGSLARCSRIECGLIIWPRQRNGRELGRGRVKDALCKFESPSEKKTSAPSANGRSRSFHDEQPASSPWLGLGAGGAATKYRRVPYQELDQRERFPGLDRDTARLEHHLDAATAVAAPVSASASRHLQRHKSTEFVSKAPAGYGARAANNSESVPFFVEPVGKNHFRAVRQSVSVVEQPNRR